MPLTLRRFRLEEAREPSSRHQGRRFHMEQTHRLDTSEESSPGILRDSDPDQEADDDEEADLSEIAPLGPPMVPEREGKGDENYGITAYACTIAI
jgi:hypothetical protein